MRALNVLRLVSGAPITQTSGALMLSQVLLGLSGVVAARALGPSGRGVVVGITVWMGMLPMLFLLGMNSALGVRVAQRPAEVGAAVGSALVYLVLVGIPVATTAAFLVPHIVGGLGPDAASVARWAVPAGIICGFLTEMLLSVAIARKRFFVFNGCRILLPLIPLAVAIGYTIHGGLTPTLMVAANVGAAALCLVWVAASTPWRSVSFARAALLADARFGVATAVSNWAGLANARLDFLLMSAFVSASQLGYYGVANNVMLVVTAVPYAAATILTPRVAALGSDENPDRGKVVHRQVAMIIATVRRYALVALAGGIVLGVCAPFVIPLVFGESFRPAVVLIWILIPGYVARSINAIVADGAIGMRYPRVGNVAEVIALIVTAVLLALLLPPFAARGAAIASVAAYACAAIVALIGLRRIDRRHGRSLRSTPAVSPVRPGARP